MPTPVDDGAVLGTVHQRPSPTVPVAGDALPFPPTGYTLEETEQFATRIYLALLQQSQPSRPLLVAQGMPANMVDHCLQVLASRKLIGLRQDGGWEVYSPDVALQAHATELETRARTIRASSHELAQIFYHAQSADRPPPEGVRVLRSLDELHSATAELIARAQESLVAMRDRSPRTEVLFRAPMSVQRDRIISRDGTALSNRAVFDVQVLEIENSSEVLHARADSGERARFVAGVPFSVVVVDSAGAIVDVSSYETSGLGSLLVQSGPLVRALRALVESVWRRGTSLDRVSPSGLDRRDVAILSLLAAGASDTTIARQTQISQRTVERRVRALMDRLGAGTRFQAGVQAARRGWI